MKRKFEIVVLCVFLCCLFVFIFMECPHVYADFDDIDYEEIDIDSQ